MKLFSLSLEARPNWHTILRGAAIPGVIVATCVLIATIYSLFKGLNIIDVAKIGVGLGLFFSLFGVVEIVASILFWSKDIKINSLIMLGYLLVWVACIIIILS